MNKRVYTLQFDEDIMDKFKLFYSDRIQRSDEQYVKYTVKSPDCTIKVYDTLKVVFSGEGAYDSAVIWGYEDDAWKCLDNQIGSDEVGTGDYFGPVCVAAAYVKAEDIDWLISLGIKDSKKIKDDVILKTVPLILKRIAYSQLSLDNTKYNALIKKGFNQGMIKAYLHNQAIINLRKKVNDNRCLTVIDLFVNESRYYEYIKSEKTIAKNIHFETKAESFYPAVAVGSMIARYSFLTKMHKLGKELGIYIPKGASTKVDIFATEVIKKYGEDKLGEIAKLHFKNTDRAKKALETDK